MTKLQGWFSIHPDSLQEQRILVLTLEHSGLNLQDIIGEAKQFKFSHARAVVEKAAEKAYQDNCAWARSGYSTQKKWVKKVLGNWFEYLAQAVVNSRRFTNQLPAGWATSRHRCEFGIPDLRRGTPDRVIFDANGQFHSAQSCKLFGDHTKSPPELDRANTWALNEAEKYAGALGINPELRVKTSYFSNAKNNPTIEWRGDKVCADMKGRTLEDLVSRNTPSQREFWQDFFAEFKHNVMIHATVSDAVRETFKRPDDFQHERIVAPVLAHTGPGIVNGDCGIGKTVMQMACIENRRGIYLYMPGARLALASQANNEMTDCFGFETHRAYVMSRQEWHARMGDSNLIEELSHRASDSMDLARLLYEYVAGKDQRPFIVMALEPSLIKVPKALELIRDGSLTDRDGELMPWCNDAEKIKYWWDRICDLLLDAHYDEAHNLVTGDRKGEEEKDVRRKTNMIEYLIWMNGLWRRSIYWTATLKRNGTRYDMTNSEIFGEVIAFVRPKESADRGYTVRPLIIPVRLTTGSMIDSDLEDTDADKELTYYVRAIEDAQQRCRDLGIACRMLIFTNGTTYHESFRQRIREYFQQHDQQIWCEFVQAGTDAERRQQLFREFASSDFAVMLNHNIVSEGINIPTCSGVILGRQMNAVTLIQAIGRGRRLDPADRAKLESGKLLAGDWANYRKPWGLVYTYVDESSADSRASEEFHQQLIYEMREVNGGEAWWIGPDEALNIRPRGKRDPAYADPQQNVDPDDLAAEAEYDQQFARLLIVDTADIARLESESRFWNDLGRLDLSNDDDFDRLVRML